MTENEGINKYLRGFLITISSTAFKILGWVFGVFFLITNEDDLFSGSIVVSELFSRLQIILSVFMVFKLALSILQWIVDPDKANDSKAGFTTILTRTLVVLTMLTLLSPVTINKSPSAMNDYEKKIHSDGILFGTLYSLQERIINDNVLGQIILGDNPGSKENVNKLEEIKDHFKTTLYKGFLSKNTTSSDEDDTTASALCPDAEVIKNYDNATFDYLIEHANDTCPRPNGKKFALRYTPIFGTVIAVFFIFIIISFCIDIGYRVVALAVLRLLAPIPIISYLDPNQEKSGAFGAWSKKLISIYLDLFLRLGIIYFVFNIADAVLKNNWFSMKNGMTGFLAGVAILVGLFLFAKESPKFIKDIFGIKDEGGRGLFSGFGAIAGAASFGAGLGATVLGGIGSARTNYRASKAENKENHPNQDVRNFGRNLLSGIVGGVAGTAVGGKALVGKDGGVGAVLKAQNERNARRASHSTLGGRVADSLYGIGTGQSLADKYSDVLNVNKEAFSSLKNWKDSVKSEAAKNGGAFDYTLANGTRLSGITYDQVKAAKDAGANANGEYTINGSTYAASLFGDNTMDDILDKQVNAWQAGSVRANGKTYDTVVNSETGKLYADHQRVIKKVNDAEIKVTNKSGVELSGEKLVDSYDDLGAAMGAANIAQQHQETNMRQQMRIANKQNKK